MRSEEKTTPSGLILLNKQPGMTSFDSLRDIKRMLGTGKAGHTGTLDKFAEGLLLVLTGRALKLSRWFTCCDKQYEGTICFGTETDTLDPEGSLVATAPLPARDAVESVLHRFCGEIEQAPPVYSAVHVDGERAYMLARRGNVPEMKKRRVSVYRLELLSWEPPHARIFVQCSSGTYIRSLARDIALAAGSRAHLSALVRTRVAGFSLEDAVKSEELEISNKRLFLRPIDKTVFDALGIPCFDISLEDSGKIVQGKPLMQIFGETPVFSGELNNVAAFFLKEKFIAVIERQNDKWKYGYVYACN